MADVLVRRALSIGFGRAKPGVGGSIGESGVLGISKEEVVLLASEDCEDERLGITKPLVIMQPFSSTVVDDRRLSLEPEHLVFLASLNSRSRSRGILTLNQSEVGRRARWVGRIEPILLWDTAVVVQVHRCDVARGAEHEMKTVERIWCARPRRTIRVAVIVNCW